ncbi:hypothetical protein [Moritella sp. F3]|uniref:hypothetical protein n=1 Tax=Moritella sp. F3 TaxID=2718882 RepID=UPI0018E1BDFA|nr:hypothetical protein [Moritella sp. F3]GIC77077.1 hypothetical protein FMO001_18040 [Moritella sp. F1]GIC82196.1 hypothetical protein FMO003_24770 [Moritella sp. F3]
MNFTDQQKNKMLLASPAAFLTNELPEDFVSLTEDKQAAFLSENAWVPPEDEDTSNVFQIIEDHAMSVQRLTTDITDGSNMDSNDRFFIVRLIITNGENEERSITLHNCDSKEDAVKLAMADNTRDKLEFPKEDKGYALDCTGDIALSLYSVKEVPHLDAAILRKYI